MSSYLHARSTPRRFRPLLASFLQRPGLPFADGCKKQLDKQWLWRGRQVYLVDGTTLSMPDTLENQAAYPQQPQQQEGLGFPIARAVVSLSLATGMLKHMAQERRPLSLEVREIRVRVDQPGFRVASFVAVSTLTDGDE